jgi:hypothetical protein
MNESDFLKKLAKYSGSTLVFKNESLLPGTAWINDVPIDISIEDSCLVLNSVGEFSGNSHLYSKSVNRGKGNFSRLIPHLKKVLLEVGFEQKVYLTPLSPAWAANYVLKSVEGKSKVGASWYLDLVTHPDE